jgi:hypothetical protein
MNTVGICGTNVRAACWQPSEDASLGPPGSNDEKSGCSTPARLSTSGAGVGAAVAGALPSELPAPLGASAGAGLPLGLCAGGAGGIISAPPLSPVPELRRTTGTSLLDPQPHHASTMPTPHATLVLIPFMPRECLFISARACRFSPLQTPPIVARRRRAATRSTVDAKLWCGEMTENDSSARLESQSVPARSAKPR